jgi:hypothetical protein
LGWARSGYCAAASLEDNGYHTEEYRIARGIMIQITGSKPAEMADPPRRQGKRAHP